MAADRNAQPRFISWARISKSSEVRHTVSPKSLITTACFELRQRDSHLAEIVETRSAPRVFPVWNPRQVPLTSNERS